RAGGAEDVGDRAGPGGVGEDVPRPPAQHRVGQVSQQSVGRRAEADSAACRDLPRDSPAWRSGLGAGPYGEGSQGADPQAAGGFLALGSAGGILAVGPGEAGTGAGGQGGPAARAGG